MKQGEVILVGAGPGDPELLTEKAIRYIRCADAIVYDALACPSVLNLAKPSCQLIYAGKHAGQHAMQQEETNRLLAKLAADGMLVVRLKGGDPFVFGRGGEEAEVLQTAGIPFIIVPGVSSCYSVPAYAGIPVTHRAYASSFHVITGHKKAGIMEEPDYARLAKLDGTLIFLMSLRNLPRIAAQLIRHGMSPETPAAVIQQGTTARQKTAAAMLGTIAEEALRAGIRTPAMTVIGPVAQLRESLRWFEKGALFGKRIVATGTPAHTEKTAHYLRQYGAETIEVSLIHTTQPEPGLLRQIDWSRYTWLVLTSSNGVSLLFDGLKRDGVDLRQLLHLKFAVIGKGTAEALAQQGIQADRIPEQFESRYLADALIPELTPSDRVLLLRAENGSPVLAERLKVAGAAFDSVSLYRTETDTRKKQLLDAALEDADYLFFASTSAVRAYAQLRGDQAGVCPAKIVSIGPVTTRTARELGIPVAMTAEQADISGMTACVLADAGERRESECIPS